MQLPFFGLMPFQRSSEDPFEAVFGAFFDDASCCSRKCEAPSGRPQIGRNLWEPRQLMRIPYVRQRCLARNDSKKENEEPQLTKPLQSLASAFEAAEKSIAKKKFERLLGENQLDKRQLFEVELDVSGCDPDQLRVEVKDQLLTVEGRRQSDDGSFLLVRLQRTLPEGVEESDLKASLLPDGKLRVRAPSKEAKQPRVLMVEKLEAIDQQKEKPQINGNDDGKNTEKSTN